MIGVCSERFSALFIESLDRSEVRSKKKPAHCAGLICKGVQRWCLVFRTTARTFATRSFSLFVLVATTGSLSILVAATAGLTVFFISVAFLVAATAGLAVFFISTAFFVAATGRFTTFLVTAARAFARTQQVTSGQR